MRTKEKNVPIGAAVDLKTDEFVGGLANHARRCLVLIKQSFVRTGRRVPSKVNRAIHALSTDMLDDPGRRNARTNSLVMQMLRHTETFMEAVGVQDATSGAAYVLDCLVMARKPLVAAGRVVPSSIERAIAVLSSEDAS